MTFENIIGQEKAKKILSGQLSSGKISHAYLFLGQDGVGRKKLALELAKTLNCASNAGKDTFVEPCGHCVSCDKVNKSLHPDIKMIDYAWQANLLEEEVEKQKSIKIKTIRALQHEVSLKPAESRWKIFIIDPAQDITNDAANCLLKTLEEPPAWTVIILLAKHKENLPSTVVSRSQIVLFRPLTEKEISDYLVTAKELDKKTALEIAGLADGSLSKALDLISGDRPGGSDFWKLFKKQPLSISRLLEQSDDRSKDASAFLVELLAEVKDDFRANPENFQLITREIVNSQNLLEMNVNAKLVLDSLLLKIGNLRQNLI